MAERAGVSRPTVYTRFPDELSLVKACSALGLSENSFRTRGVSVVMSTSQAI
jgi:AcrR family transcriptional regulator